MSEALAWNIPIDSIGDGLKLERSATPEELTAVAASLGIPACGPLAARFTIKALPRGRFRLAGSLEADVVQSCVVSLDPVPDHVSETFEVELCPPDQLTVVEVEEVDLDDAPSILDVADEEPLAGNAIPVGRIVFETLATGLDPYPRAPGVALEISEAGGPTETDSPFAVLARLTGKPPTEPE